MKVQRLQERQVKNKQACFVLSPDRDFYNKFIFLTFRGKKSRND